MTCFADISAAIVAPHDAFVCRRLTGLPLKVYIFCVFAAAMLAVASSTNDNSAPAGGGRAASTTTNVHPTNGETQSSKAKTCWNVCRCTTVGNATTVNCSHASLDSLPLAGRRGGEGDAFPVFVRTLAADWNRMIRLDANLSLLAPDLEAVSFDHNNISDVASDAFRGLRSLRRVSLVDNRIEKLPAQVFADAVGLEELSLGSNPLDVVSVGAALSHLVRLRRLDVSRTSVGQFGPLPEALFGHLDGLEHLVMRDVTIENMTADYFSALHSGLTTLDLTDVNINKVDDEAFVALSSTLSELILDNVIATTKDLENIFAGFRQMSPTSSPPDADSFTNVTTAEPQVTTTTMTMTSQNHRLDTISMRSVFVDESGESSVNAHIFRHLGHTRLTTLRFDRNYFGHHLGGKVPERLFHPLRHLTSLSMSYCDIRSIPSDTFKGLHHLQVLSL